MLTVFGSIALDTTRTPHATHERILGGAATFAALSASNYVTTSVVGVVGTDFPPRYRALLDSKLDTRGIVMRTDTNTFHFDSSFDFDLIHRSTNLTELNAISGYEPRIPESYVDSDYVYLANNDPEQNLEVLELFSAPKLTVCDTIDYWIVHKKKMVLKMMGKVDGIVISEQEGKLLCNETNILKCGRLLASLGPKFVVIKKGESGAILFHENDIYPVPAFPTQIIRDPTGAGDSFAGALIGYLARNKRFKSRDLRKAVIHGNVLGSFAIEEFGVTRLLTLNKTEILERYSEYNRILNI
jgi:sugar/nucleoside kinase (ribokinase family)